MRDNLKITISWHVDDILQIRPDLNDDQAYQVLLSADNHHDADQGITWEILEAHAETLFPETDQGELPLSG